MVFDEPPRRDRLAPEVIQCVDCGGRAHLLTRLDPDDPVRPGDLLTYRCSDCHDRWDLVAAEEDQEEGEGTVGVD